MAIFDNFTIGTPSNFISFNDENTDPYFRVTRRYPTRRELREFDIALPESSGIADYQTFIGKEYMIFEGKMYPNSETTFHSGRETIRKLASLTVEQNDPNSDYGYVPFKWTENVLKQLMIKIEYVDMQESTAQGLIQPFRLLCKVKYPAITSQSTKTIVLTADTMVGGGAVYPMTYPAIFGSSTNSANGTLTNSGDMDAYPTITINGPINHPRITNVTTGEYIELGVNLPTSSDTATLNYDADSVSVIALNANAYALLTSGSTLFKIKPGANALTLSGTSISTGAAVNVSCLDTWPLS